MNEKIQNNREVKEKNAILKRKTMWGGGFKKQAVGNFLLSYA